MGDDIHVAQMDTIGHIGRCGSIYEGTKIPYHVAEPHGWQIGGMTMTRRHITDRVERAIASMLAGSLRYYADEACQDGDGDEAHSLYIIADHIEDGTATEDEWLEAIEQVDVSDDTVRIAW